MKKIINYWVALFSLILFAAFPAYALETYQIDPMHTYVLWHIDHFGFSNQAGKFIMVDGSLELDETKPENSKIKATIHMDKMATGIPKLEEHLKSKDFFDVAKYPTATFISDKINVTGKDTATIDGTLTMHGVSKPIVLDVKMLKFAMHPIKNKKSIGISATTTIKRSDFGITKYTPMLGDEVKVEIGAEIDAGTK